MGKPRFLIGIDEAGRGPLAGPVAVGAVCLPFTTGHRVSGSFVGRVRDSKRLTPRKREELFARMREHKKGGLINFAVALVGHELIDRWGIVRAMRLALRRCLCRLRLPPAECLVLLDGGLRAPKRFARQRAIIRGDETEPIIALASVAAKVVRDRKMLFWAKRYPDYGFEKHKGYGTKAHYRALKKFGPSPVHRHTFLGSKLRKSGFLSAVR